MGRQLSPKGDKIPSGHAHGAGERRAGFLAGVAQRELTRRRPGPGQFHPLIFAAGAEEADDPCLAVVTGLEAGHEHVLRRDLQARGAGGLTAAGRRGQQRLAEAGGEPARLGRVRAPVLVLNAISGRGLSHPRRRGANGPCSKTPARKLPSHAADKDQSQ